MIGSSNELRRMYLDDIGVHEENNKEILDISRELMKFLHRTNKKLEETGKMLDRSHYRKTIFKKIKNHTGTQALHLQMIPQEDLSDMTKKLNLKKEFKEFLSFMLEYVFPLGSLCDKPCICKNCWLIFFPTTKVLARQSKKLVLLDKDFFSSRYFKLEEKAATFLQNCFVHPKKVKPDEVPFPEILIPGSKENPNLPHGKCRDFFKLYKEAKEARESLQENDQSESKQIASRNEEEAEWIEEGEEEESSNGTVQPDVQPEYEDLHALMIHGPRDYLSILVEHQDGKHYEHTMGQMRSALLKYRPKR